MQGYLPFLLLGTKVNLIVDGIFIVFVIDYLLPEVAAESAYKAFFFTILLIQFDHIEEGRMGL